VKDRHCVHFSAHMTMPQPKLSGYTGSLGCTKAYGESSTRTMRQVLEIPQMGSLSGAEHLLNDNADVRRLAQSGQKPLVEYKGKSTLKRSGMKTDRV